MDRKETGGDAAGQSQGENPRVGMAEILVETSVSSYSTNQPFMLRTFSRSQHTKFIPLLHSGHQELEKKRVAACKKKAGSAFTSVMTLEQRDQQFPRSQAVWAGTVQLLLCWGLHVDFFPKALTCCRLVGCCVWHGDGPVFLLINFLLETRTKLFSWGSRAIYETWVTVHALKK